MGEMGGDVGQGYMLLVIKGVSSGDLIHSMMTVVNTTVLYT